MAFVCRVKGCNRTFGRQTCLTNHVKAHKNPNSRAIRKLLRKSKGASSPTSTRASASASSLASYKATGPVPAPAPLLELAPATAARAAKDIEALAESCPLDIATEKKDPPNPVPLRLPISKKGSGGKGNGNVAGGVKTAKKRVRSKKQSQLQVPSVPAFQIEPDFVLDPDSIQPELSDLSTVNYELFFHTSMFEEDLARLAASLLPEVKATKEAIKYPEILHVPFSSELEDQDDEIPLFESDLSEVLHTVQHEFR